MTINEAIKELKTWNSATFEVSFVSFSNALQLGIEALKREKECRENAPRENWLLLPRETKE